MINRFTLFIQALLISFFLTSKITTAHAHSGATGIVKERMDMMKKIGENMKGMKSMVQKKVPFDSEKMKQHAATIRELSTHIKNGFPEGSLKGKSEALPAIWKEWEKFSSLADKLTNEAEKMMQVADNTDPKSIMKQFASVGKTCRSCHTDFRQKKDKP